MRMNFIFAGLVCTLFAGCSPQPTVVVDPKPAATDWAKIDSIASNSSCAAYSWKNRGRAPVGYIKGVTRAYVDAICKYRSPQSTIAGLIGKPAGDPSQDVLVHYGIVGSDGETNIKTTFALLIGLGMRESSGKYYEGVDISAGASSMTASTAEAGLFQASFNSMGAHPKLKELYSSFKSDQKDCDLKTFQEGLGQKTTKTIGSGEGARFQELSKSCPRFTTLYAAGLIRVLRKHFGPLNRKEAEFSSSCLSMLDQVDKQISCK